MSPERERERERARERRGRERGGGADRDRDTEADKRQRPGSHLRNLAESCARCIGACTEESIGPTPPPNHPPPPFQQQHDKLETGATNCTPPHNGLQAIGVVSTSVHHPTASQFAPSCCPSFSPGVDPRIPGPQSTGLQQDCVVAKHDLSGHKVQQQDLLCIVPLAVSFVAGDFFNLFFKELKRKGEKGGV